ncbi:hypothetical protein M422DRAFT_780624 [Sphaerobolus stellatus SS14]|uniref:Major facilitator superfamily (MFS) profile domain-containing protein n=1 Tax=Sphaerobolus stellatus (strain SS14) TaxID=990650 RepID=A0A0C9V1S8_SPHS4|nr:hypothetical protein M422DRAFT_780624 [Sphaerobolus stellatus SS14]
MSEDHIEDSSGHGEGLDVLSEAVQTETAPLLSSPITLPRSTALPWRSLFIVQLLTAGQPLALDVIFPFVNQMILDVGIAKHPEEVGFYSGIIMAMYPATSFLAVMPASHLSDLAGRKTVVLLGLSGMAISTIWFGLSKTFSSMLISRALSGILGSVFACTRIIVAELTDKTNQARALQWHLLSYKFGQIIGLPLGGLLAHPEHHFPTVFDNEFWNNHPFALPCFVTGGYAIFSVILGYVYLPETAPRWRLRVHTVNAEPNTDVAASSISYNDFLTRPILSVMLASFNVGLLSDSLKVIFPLFCFTPIGLGGLGMSEAAIGFQMVIRSVLQLGTLPFYHQISTHFNSTTHVHRTFMWIWSLPIIILPCANLVARTTDNIWTLNACLFLFHSTWSLASFTYLTLNNMIVDVTPSAEALSTVNGLSMLTMALPQAVAPAFIAPLFAYSVETANGYIVWIIFLVLSLFSAIHSMTLKEPINNWRDSHD